MYTVKEVSVLLNVTRQALYKWIKQGKVEAVHLGKFIRINEAEVERIRREGIWGWRR